MRFDWMVDRTKAPVLNEYGELSLTLPGWRTLPNGLQLCVVNGGEVEVNRVDVYVGGGLFEQPKRYVAQLLNYMLAKGTSQYSAEEIAEQMDFYGAISSGSTSDHNMKISLRSTNDNLGKLLPIFFDMLTTPQFPQIEFDKLVDRLVANVTVRMQRVSAIAGGKLSQMCFGEDSPLAQEKSADVIREVTIDDLRRFHETRFAPGNCRVVLSGKIDDDVLALVEKYFGGWQDREFEPLVGWHIEPQNEMYAVVDKPDALQTAVAIAIDAIGREHPDYIALRILVTAFGGYFGSRLMSNIREDKGYTYGIQAYLIGRKEHGYVGISTECASQYTQSVIDEIKHEMARLREEKIGHEELQMVRNHMLSDLVKTLDTPFALAGYVDSTISYGVDPDYFNRQYGEIRSITPARLHEMAKKYLVEDKMRIALAGDAKNMI